MRKPVSDDTIQPFPQRILLTKATRIFRLLRSLRMALNYMDVEMLRTLITLMMTSALIQSPHVKNLDRSWKGTKW